MLFWISFGFFFEFFQVNFKAEIQFKSNKFIVDRNPMEIPSVQN